MKIQNLTSFSTWSLPSRDGAGVFTTTKYLYIDNKNNEMFRTVYIYPQQVVLRIRIQGKSVRYRTHDRTDDQTELITLIAIPCSTITFFRHNGKYNICEFNQKSRSLKAVFAISSILVLASEWIKRPHNR